MPIQTRLYKTYRLAITSPRLKTLARLVLAVIIAGVITLAIMFLIIGLTGGLASADTQEIGGNIEASLQITDGIPQGTVPFEFIRYMDGWILVERI